MKTYLQFQKEIQPKDSKEVAVLMHCCGPRPEDDEDKPEEKSQVHIGFIHCCGPRPKEDIKENLNPRGDTPIVSNVEPHHNGVLVDPLFPLSRKDEQYGRWGEQDKYDHPYHVSRLNPEHETEGEYNTFHGYTVPFYQEHHIPHIQDLYDNTRTNDEDYRHIIPIYTSGSAVLNSRLYTDYLNGVKTPDNIDLENSAGDGYEDEYEQHKNGRNPNSTINIRDFDSLIRRSRVHGRPTVYSGLHFDPEETIGKIIHTPSYLSVSNSLNTAKDFGRRFGNSRYRVKNIMRVQLPEGHPGVWADPHSRWHGQSEIILPRNLRWQFGSQPSHIIEHPRTQLLRDSFSGNHRSYDVDEFRIWNARILPGKK